MPRNSARRRKGNRKRSSKLLKYLSYMSVVVVSLLFLFLYGFYRVLDKDFTSASSSSSHDISSNDLTVYLYASADSSFAETPIKLDDVKVLIFDKVDGLVTVLNVPVSYETDLPGRFGIEPLSNVFALGDLSDPAPLAGGSALLVDVVQNIISLKVDRYLVVDSSISEEFSDVLNAETGSFSLPFLLSNYKDSLITDMSLGEFYSLHTDLTQMDRVFEDFDATSIDMTVREITFDNKLALEGVSIAILNANNIPNAAGFGSRVVKNVGGRVIAVENANQVYDISYLVVSDKSLLTVNYLVDFFDVKKILSKEEASFLGESVIDRADVTLIMGLDIKDRL